LAKKLADNGKLDEYDIKTCLTPNDCLVRPTKSTPPGVCWSMPWTARTKTNTRKRQEGNFPSCLRISRLPLL